jgi:hypothetical protein
VAETLAYKVSRVGKKHVCIVGRRRAQRSDTRKNVPSTGKMVKRFGNFVLLGDIAPHVAETTVKPDSFAVVADLSHRLKVVPTVEQIGVAARGAEKGIVADP